MKKIAHYNTVLHKNMLLRPNQIECTELNSFWYILCFNAMDIVLLLLLYTIAHLGAGIIQSSRHETFDSWLTKLQSNVSTCGGTYAHVVMTYLNVVNCLGRYKMSFDPSLHLASPVSNWSQTSSGTAVTYPVRPPPPVLLLFFFFPRVYSLSSVEGNYSSLIHNKLLNIHADPPFDAFTRL